MAVVRHHIDEQLEQWRGVGASIPASGWVRAIRSSLGMSVTDLARRMGISQPSVSQLERAELDGSVTLARLQRAAAALDCRLVYALVPDAGTTAEQVGAQARERAQADLEAIMSTMELEDQPVSARAARRMLDDAIATWKSDRRLWAP